MSGNQGSSLADVDAFLNKLQDARIHFNLLSAREGAIMVCVTVPGERWEVEFFEDRAPEIEIFRSDGSIQGADFLGELFNKTDN